MYTLASRGQRGQSVVDVGGVRFGEGFVIIAGPCAIEDAWQIDQAARGASSAGAAMLRGGAFKPRTSPYSFQGLGEEAVGRIARAAAKYRLPTVVEALAEAHVAYLAPRVTMMQIGARNMQNFALLRAVARAGAPVLLKRGPAATLDELLYAAEYLLVEGNEAVVLCERGVRGFDPHTRNLFDLAGALRLKELTHLPVIVDPSHATGRRSLIAPLVFAAAAAGLDGAMVEVHPNPAVARSDGEQALDPPSFEALMTRLGTLLAFAGGSNGPAKVASAAGR